MYNAVFVKIGWAVCGIGDLLMNRKVGKNVSKGRVIAWKVYTLDVRGERSLATLNQHLTLIQADSDMPTPVPARSPSLA